jgi:glyoxylase-like metal-dependent hydrolase (beta-lactamase superfamily II)
VVALCVWCSGALGQDWQAVEVRRSQVAPGLHVLQGRGGNIAVLVGEDGVLLVDDEFPELADKIRAAIATLTPAPIRLVVNTNWHFDHANGNELMARAGAIIVAHERSRAHMLVEQQIPEFDPNLRIPPYPRLALPVITVKDSATLHFNGEEIELTHVPGAHSDGDLLVHFRKANVLHTGDLFFSKGLPFIHVSGGGSVDGMLRAADVILGLCDADTEVIPGHGQVSDRDGVREYREVLLAGRDRIAALLAQGKTLEEVVAAKPVEDPFARAGSGVPAALFAKLAYLDLAGKTGKQAPPGR